MKCAVIVFAWLLSATASSHALARISVSPTNGGVYTIHKYDDHEFGLELRATAENSVTLFFITRSTENDVIRFIDVESSNPGGNTGLIIGSINEPIREVQEISLLSEDGFTYISSMYLSSHLGKARLNGIELAVIGGDTDKIDVVLHERGSPFIGSMTVYGDVLGDITLEDDGKAVFGNLYSLNVLGTIGTPEAFVNIAVGGWIVRLTAGEINANIKGTRREGPGSFVGQIFQLASLGIGQTSGDIRGEIRCHMTDWPGVEDRVVIQAVGRIEGTILVGRSLFEKMTLTSEILTLEEQGLKGRILINALDLGGTWTAPVKVGPYTSQIVIDGNGYPEPGGYPNSTASLGGGTIGVVPFRLHRTDCDPVHGSVIEWDDATNRVCMRHYGPVTWNPEDGEPYMVERRKADSSDSWQEQDCFVCEPDEDNDTIVWVKTTKVERLHRGFEYRVSLRTRSSDNERILRCNLTAVDGSTPQVAYFDPLSFTVCDASAPHTLGDANDDGCVNFVDISTVLANWRSDECMKLGDADRDGDVDFDDIAVVLMNFSADC